MSENEQTWSNKLPADGNPLMLDVLRRAVQRLEICGLCGLKVELKDRALTICSWIAHATCARGRKT